MTRDRSVFQTDKYGDEISCKAIWLLLVLENRMSKLPVWCRDKTERFIHA